MDKSAATNLIQTAYEAGCPEEQVRQFLSSGYVALPHLWRYHAAARQVDEKVYGIREIMLDGTRGSAKSHAIIAQVGLDDCQRVPGLKYLFLRLTQKAAGQSFGDLVARVLHGVTHTQNTEQVTFANGSRIVIGGFKDDNDVTKYQGIEYDGLVLEEATHISGDKYERLLGSVRTSKPNWVPRVYLSSNPGGLGHLFFRQRFVDPEKNRTQTFTRRYFSSYLDNPFIDDGYKRYLEGLTGDLARAWRDGDWDIFEGQAFGQFREALHVVQPFEIPAHWTRWRGIDWGNAAPFCCLWGAHDPDTGRVVVYREIYKTGLSDVQQARQIMDMTPQAEQVGMTFADPSMWAKDTKDSVVTSSQMVYAQQGLMLTKADNDRYSGKRKVDRMLANLPDGKPGLLIFCNCVNLVRTLPQLIYDKVRIEDVDTTGEDHAYDALRYLLTTVRHAQEPTMRTKQNTNPWLGLKGL